MFLSKRYINFYFKQIKILIGFELNFMSESVRKISKEIEKRIDVRELCEFGELR